MTGSLAQLVLSAFVCGAASGGFDVSGRIVMPNTCSPAVSPAVVRLEPIEQTGSSPGAGDPAVIHRIDQQGMRFDPRIVALRVGETVQFGNSDPDLHNVHVGNNFNRGITPGSAADFVPKPPGIYRVVCDVHAHMRAYLVVGATSWVTTCGRTGAFRFEKVPPGRYRLLLWHEMGTPSEKVVEVKGSGVDLGNIVVTEGPNPATAADRDQTCATGCEPWPLVIDRIAVTLAASLDAAGRPAAADRAVPLAQDAFYRDFEASGLDAAVRVHLGRERASRLEGLLHEVTDTTGAVVAGNSNPPSLLAPTRLALLDLAKASAELNGKGVTERSKIFATTSPAFWVESAPAATPARPDSDGGLRRFALPLGGITAVVALVLLLKTRGDATGPRRRSYQTAALGLLAVSLGLVAFRFATREPADRAAPLPLPASSASARSSATPRAQAGPPSATGAAPVRERPVGVDVTRNHLRIASSWYPAVKVAGASAPARGEIDIVAHVHATEGNPNGFARGEWVPYLSIQYTLQPDGGGPASTGTFRPLLAAEGPRYVARLAAPDPGKYRLTLRLAPPSPDLVGRLDDPASGVAPWWQPFDATFDGSFPAAIAH